MEDEEQEPVEYTIRISDYELTDSQVYFKKPLEAYRFLKSLMELAMLYGKTGKFMTLDNQMLKTERFDGSRSVRDFKYRDHWRHIYEFQARISAGEFTGITKVLQLPDSAAILRYREECRLLGDRQRGIAYYLRFKKPV